MLTAEEKMICELTGVSPELFEATKRAMAREQAPAPSAPVSPAFAGLDATEAHVVRLMSQRPEDFLATKRELAMLRAGVR